jgi:hypothetical protein
MDENDIDRQLQDEQKYLDDQLLRYVVSEFAKRNLAGGVTLPETVKDAINTEFERAVKDSGALLRETVSQAVQDLDRALEKLRASSVNVAENLAQPPPHPTQDGDFAGRVGRPSANFVQPPPSPDKAARASGSATAAERPRSSALSKICAVIKSPWLWFILICPALVAALVFCYIVQLKSDNLCNELTMISRVSTDASNPSSIVKPNEYLLTLEAINKVDDANKLTADQRSVIYLRQVQAITESKLRKLKDRRANLEKYCGAGRI